MNMRKIKGKEKRKKMIIHVLRNSKEEVPAWKLGNILGGVQESTIRFYMNELRSDDNQPIISTNHGYKFLETKKDFQEWKSTQLGRIKKLSLAIEGVEKGMKKVHFEERFEDIIKRLKINENGEIHEKIN